MTTKHNSVGMNRGIYDSPFDAFTNYMNILGDFISRVNNLYPTDMDNEELNSLLTTIQNQDEEIAAKDREIEKLQKQLEKYNPSKSPELKADKEKRATVKKEPEKKAPAKKAPAKKAPAKKEEAEVKPKAKKTKKSEK